MTATQGALGVTRGGAVDARGGIAGGEALCAQEVEENEVDTHP